MLKEVNGAKKRQKKHKPRECHHGEIKNLIVVVGEQTIINYGAIVITSLMTMIVLEMLKGFRDLIEEKSPFKIINENSIKYLITC